MPESKMPDEEKERIKQAHVSRLAYGLHCLGTHVKLKGEPIKQMTPEELEEAGKDLIVDVCHLIKATNQNFDIASFAASVIGHYSDEQIAYHEATCKDEIL